MFSANKILSEDVYFVLKPPDEYRTGFEIFLMEFFFTTLFTSIIFFVKYSLAPTTDGTLKTFMVVFALYACIGCIGKFTNACLNPMIGFPALTYYAIVSPPGTVTYIGYLPSYVIGPISGGIFASLITKFHLMIEDKK